MSAGQTTQKIAMLKRWFKILSGSTQVAIKQGRGRAYSCCEVRGYYNDLTGKVVSGILTDDVGVPLSVIAGGEKRYFPIAIFQYALGCYDEYMMSGDKLLRNRFMVCADWAINNQRQDGSWDAFGPIGSEKYTVSSMAQGEGSSVLVRAYVESGESRYLESAQSAVNFMLTPVSEGGTSDIEGNAIRLEEYPQIPRRSVLNGWIFSLFGIYDLSLILPEYRVSFLKSAATLAQELQLYDAKYWSYYDLEGRLASPAYHQLHIALLDVMAELSQDERFAKASNLFRSYEQNVFNRSRAFVVKIIQKLFEKSDAVIVQ